MREEKEGEPVGVRPLPGPAGQLRTLEIGGYLLQMTEPEITYRDEGDKTICRVDYSYRWIDPPKAESARPPESSKGSQP